MNAILPWGEDSPLFQAVDFLPVFEFSLPCCVFRCFVYSGFCVVSLLASLTLFMLETGLERSLSTDGSYHSTYVGRATILSHKPEDPVLGTGEVAHW